MMTGAHLAPDRCVAPTRTGRRCPYDAKVITGDRPMCTRHAAIAARKAAEAAEEAAYWEKKFAPRPGQPYRTDPEWQAAVREQLAEHPGENDNDMLVRAMRAIHRRYEIEARYRPEWRKP